MSGIIITLLIIFYRIPLIRIVGDTGMGFYSTAMVIYLLLMTCTAYGLPKAVSDILVFQGSKGRYALVYQTVQKVIAFSLIIGGIFSVILFAGADFISDFILNSALSASVIRCLSPGFLLITFMGAMHGIFSGIKAVRISIISYILEALLAALFSIIGAIYFVSFFSAEAEEVSSVCGGAAGFTCGLAIACIYMSVMLFKYLKKLYLLSLKDDEKLKDGHQHIIRKIVLAMMPVVLTIFLFQISNLMDYVIFNRIMKVQGYKETEYIKLLGILKGKCDFFVSIPIFIVTGYAASKLSYFMQIVKTDNKRKINKMFGKVFRYVMDWLIPVSTVFIMYSEAFLDLCFGDSTTVASHMLKAEAVNILFWGLLLVSNVALNSIGKWYQAAKNTAIAVCVQCISMLILLIIFEWKIGAVILGHIIFSLTVYVLNEHVLRESTGYVQEMKRTIYIPLVSSGIMGSVSYFVYFFVNIFAANKFALLVILPVAIITYIISMVVLGGITQREVYTLPGGKYLAPLCKKMHFIN